MSERDPREAGRPTPASPRAAERPTRVRIDLGVCDGYGACLAVAPGALAQAAVLAAASARARVAGDVPMPDRATADLPASSAVLDAMAACPTGAIRWVEPADAAAEDAALEHDPT